MISSVLVSLLFNGWYIAYFYLLQPHVLARLAAVPETKDVGLGIVLLALQLIEVLGLWLKYPAVADRIRRYPNDSPAGFLAVMAALLGHMGLTTGLMSFATISAFGVDMRGTTPLVPGLLSLFFFMAMLTKEGGLLAFVLDYQKRTSPQPRPGDSLPVSGLNRRHPRLAETLADVILALFGAVAYTVTWEQVVASSFLVAETLGGQIVELAGAVLFFLLVFPALRPLSVADAWLVKRAPKDRLLSTLTFLITMVAAIAAIPRGG